MRSWRSLLVVILASLPLAISTVVLALAAPATQENLVYFPLENPCRVVDTRVAGGAFAANTQRNYRVTGVNISGQGGSSTCGIPTGATAIALNVAAIDASASGFLRVWAFGDT